MSAMEGPRRGRLLPIIAKTVCASEERLLKKTMVVQAGSPVDTLLGAQVVDFAARGSSSDGRLVIDAACEVHVWYSCSRAKEQRTEVTKQSFELEEAFEPRPIPGVERLNSQEEIYTAVTENARVTEARLQDDNKQAISITVAARVNVDVVGDSKLWVRTYSPEGSGGHPGPPSFKLPGGEDHIPLPDEEAP